MPQNNPFHYSFQFHEVLVASELLSFAGNRQNGFQPVGLLEHFSSQVFRRRRRQRPTLERRKRNVATSERRRRRKSAETIFLPAASLPDLLAGLPLGDVERRPEDDRRQPGAKI